MTPHENVVRRLAGEWLAKAESDHRAAATLLANTDSLREIIAFHCQQAVEKYLKALLVVWQVQFPRTHNIGTLLDLIATVDEPLAASLSNSTILTPFGVEIRYPGDSPELLPGTEHELLEIVGCVSESVKARLQR